MLWTVLTLFVWLWIGAIVFYAILACFFGLVTFPERWRQRRQDEKRRELREHHEWELVRTNPLARFVPRGDIRFRGDIPLDVRQEAERYPALSRHAKWPEIEHHVTHWLCIRKNYGYLPMKPRIRLSPTVYTDSLGSFR